MTIDSFLNTIRKQNLSILPTPVHRLNKLSEILGVNLWCKRDDLTGFAFGGNKTRKLDYLMAEAVELGAKAIIAIGSNQSNFCRMAAAAAKANGMEAHLILAGDEPEKETGNLLLDRLFGARVHRIPSYDLDLIAEKQIKIMAKLNCKGIFAYPMPLGGSTPLGTLGYVNAFAEILDFQTKNDISFSNIFVATGSAGTQAGLILGKALAKWEGQINGIAAGVNSDTLINQLKGLVKDAAYIYEIDCVDPEINLDENYIGEGYGIPSEAGKEAIELFAQNEGIVLDEVYTAKAAAGMIDLIRSGKIRKNSDVLFIHTGGSVQLFE